MGFFRKSTIRFTPGPTLCLLAATGNAQQRAQWLPALAAGEKRIAFAAWEPQSRFDASQIKTRAERTDGGYRLNGTKELVAGAPGADALIVSALCEPPSGVAGDAPQPATFRLVDRTWGPEPGACDFIWVSRSLRQQVKAWTVDGATQASDHQPVMLTLG